MLRAVVCDYVGPAECAGMLKLVTRPRSRQKRNGWRATPGRSGGCSVPPPPPNASPNAPEDACRKPSGTPEQAGAAARARTIGPIGGRSVAPAQERSGEPSGERRSESVRWWSAAALFLQRKDGAEVRRSRGAPEHAPRSRWTERSAAAAGESPTARPQPAETADAATSRPSYAVSRSTSG